MKSDYSKKSEREAALDILLKVLEEGCFSGAAIDKELKRCPRTPESRAFITRLCEGTIERLITIDDVIDSCASVRCRKMKPAIRNILRESVYQMLFMDNVADAVAVNEAVTLTRKRGFAGLANFVNGVLRTVGRKKSGFSFYSIEEKTVWANGGNSDWEKHASIYYSVPEWLVRHMEKAAGRERAEAVFRDFLTVRPLQARINLSGAKKREVIESLTSEKIRVTDHPYLENILCLEGTSLLTRTKAFREGRIQVQDASSVLAVKAAGIRPGMRVLDVCAAPGGKSLYAADILGSATDDSGKEKRENSTDKKETVPGELNSPAENVSQGSMPAQSPFVRSRDLTEAKVRKIRENAVRCHLDGMIQAEVADARVFDPSLEAWADVVIADLPCSGLGVIAKKPDIKYRVKPEDLTGLAALQREILSVVWRYVKPGGVLIYSTCTVSPEENQENVRWFLSQGYPMEADDMTPYLPERLVAEVREKRQKATEVREIQGEGILTELQLLPGEYETDGFFIARFLRHPNQEHEEKTCFESMEP